MGDGGGGDLGASIGPDVNPADDKNIVVDHSDSSGIVLGADGGGYAVLPPRPARPDDDADDDAGGGPATPAGPPESGAT